MCKAIHFNPFAGAAGSKTRPSAGAGCKTQAPESDLSNIASRKHSRTTILTSSGFKVVISAVFLFSRVLCNDIELFSLGGQRKILKIKISPIHFKNMLIQQISWS